MAKKTWLSEWYSDDMTRTARLYSDTFGYDVEFTENGQVVDYRRLWEHSKQYAEDACENWVERIIK